MAIIPDFKPTGGNYQPQTPSLGAAMAAGKAMQNVGAGISQVGDDLGEYQAQLSRARDAGVKANASLLMQNAFAEHEEYRASNPDETTWEADMKKRVGTVREKLASEPMSHFMKTELDATLSGWESNSIHGTRLDGLKQTRARARQRITNAAEAYKAAGDYESARKTLESGRGSAYHPEETDADLLRLDAEENDHRKEQAHKAALSEIDSDPFAAREKYQSPTPPDGADPTEYQRARQYHAQRLASEQNNIVDSIRDGIAAGKIVRPDQLDDYADELGAATVATLKSGMEKAADEGRRKTVAMPAYQARMIGAVSSAIDELDVNDIEGRVRIEARLDDIQPGPTKTQLSDALSRKLKGEPEDPGPMRRVRSLLNEATRRGYFGPVAPTTPQTTADVVADDFLMDGAKLQGLGLSQEAADSILDPKLSNEKRLAKFRELYPKRDAEKATADEYTTRAADALVNRENTVAKTPGEGAAEFRDAWGALQRKGEIERGLIDWQKDHPEGDVEAELMRRMGDAESTKFLDAVDGGQWFGDEFDTAPTGDPQRPDLPATNGGASDSLLPPIPQY